MAVGAFVERHLGGAYFMGMWPMYSIFPKDWVSLEWLFIEEVSMCLFIMDKALNLMIFLWNFSAKRWFAVKSKVLTC